MNIKLKSLLIGAALYMGVMGYDPRKPFREEEPREDGLIDPVQDALEEMERKNPSLSYEVEQKEGENCIMPYSNRIVVADRVGTDFETNQPVYELELEELPLRDLQIYTPNKMFANYEFDSGCDLVGGHVSDKDFPAKKLYDYFDFDGAA